MLGYRSREEVTAVESVADSLHHPGASLFLPEKVAQVLQFPIPATKLTAILDVLVDVVEPLLNPIQRFSKGKDLEDQPANLKIGILGPQSAQLGIVGASNSGTRSSPGCANPTMRNGRS